MLYIDVRECIYAHGVPKMMDSIPPKETLSIKKRAEEAEARARQNYNYVLGHEKEENVRRRITKQFSVKMRELFKKPLTIGKINMAHNLCARAEFARASNLMESLAWCSDREVNSELLFGQMLKCANAMGVPYIQVGSDIAKDSEALVATFIFGWGASKAVKRLTDAPTDDMTVVLASIRAMKKNNMEVTNGDMNALVGPLGHDDRVRGQQWAKEVLEELLKLRLSVRGSKPTRLHLPE